MTDPVPGPVVAGRVGVVDIGSNTVRLVVYDVPTRLPIPMFNEKAQCQLGKGLAHTGKLNPDGITLALDSLNRFTRLARAMGVGQLHLVATAAVRDADDGPAFVQQINDRFGLDVEVLTGEEEAKLAALGLLSGVPDADGLLGDMGGGSLDLVHLEKGDFGAPATFPLGHLALAEASDNDPRKAVGIVRRLMEETPGLEQASGRNLYAIGGALRAVARIFIDQTGYPLHVLDNYSLRGDEALRLTRVIAGLSRGSLERIEGVSRRRVEGLPYAAVVLEVLLEMLRPKELVFSGFGMREGQLLKTLPECLRRQDPLIAGCQTLAEHGGRFSIGESELMDWLTPAFATETPVQRRRRHATALLSDIAWNEHPDYRAIHAFERVLTLPYAGLSHQDRAAIALGVFVRYNGDVSDPRVASISALLDEAALPRIEAVGLGLRLAHTLSGSAPGVLNRSRLNVSPETLVLVPPEDGFLSEVVERRLKTFAKKLGLQPSIHSV
ncbi:MAG: exopolyphosphatase [Magnetovibrionaceae bacterium]